MGGSRTAGEDSFWGVRGGRIVETGPEDSLLWHFEEGEEWIDFDRGGSGMVAGYRVEKVRRYFKDSLVLKSLEMRYV